MASSSTTPSSFSILSAKAPPFVPPSTTKPNSALSAKAPPFANPNYNRPSIVGAPYYPSYDGHFDSELLGFEGFLSSSYDGGDALELSYNFEDLQEVNIGPWNAPFDEKEIGKLEESDWVSSLWRVPSLDLQGVQPKVTVPRKFSGISTSTISSQLSTSTSAMESCSAHSKSYSDNYGAQVYTYSTTPMPCCPVSTHSSLAQAYGPSAPGTSLNADPLSKTLDLVRFLPQESTAFQNVKGKEPLRGANDKSSTNTPQIGLSNSGFELPLTKPVKLAKPLISESEFIKPDNSMKDSSETASQPDDDVDSPCYKGTLAYRGSPFHHETAATPHLTLVRSVTEIEPYIPATVGGANTTYSVESSEMLISDETKKASSMPHSGKSLGVACFGLQRRSEHSNILDSDGNCKRIQCLDIGREERADLSKDTPRISEVLELIQGITDTSANPPTATDGLTISESRYKDAVQDSSSNIQSCVVDVGTYNVAVESHGALVRSGQPSSSGNYAQLIDETLRCLRKMLLCHAYKDDNTLKELLNDILLLVNDYPGASIPKSKKGIDSGGYNDLEAAADQSPIVVNAIQEKMVKEGDTVLTEKNIKTYYDTSIQDKMQPFGHRATHRQGVDFQNFAWEFTRSQIIGSKDAVSQSNISITHGMKEKPSHFVGSNMHNKFNNFSDVSGSNMHNKFNNFSDVSSIGGMANDFEKILKKSFCEQEENLLVSLHKNLWIDAQTELFSIKHELELARSEIEMLKRNQFAIGFPQETNRSPRLSYWLDSQVSSSRNFPQDMNEGERNDASPVNRLEVFKGGLSIDQVCV